jgi:DNA-binding NtrC family response regulator
MTARVLMVDDEPDAALLFQQHFRREIRQGAYVFEFADSGEAALACLESYGAPRVMLILSDINMPGMSGLDLLSEVKARWPELVVFMITAYGDADTERRARERGADAFINKPVDFTALKEAMRAAVAHGDDG